MYPHRIRLRGPWEWQAGEASGTIVLPGSLAGVAGRVTFRRRFGYPGTIDTHERVWLLAGSGAATLNGVPLGAGVAFDVTALLRPRNELGIEVDGPTPGDVALEVRATAYLADVEMKGGTITGRVVGEAAGPLDLYAIASRHTVAQASVRATPEGTPFVMTAERGDGGVRVELVNGAVIWYSIPLTGP
jgi:hypothetical protein